MNNRQLNNPNIVKNYSQKELDDDELQVLAKGLNFAMNHTKKDVLNFVAAVETGISDIRDITQNEKIALRQRVVASVHSAQQTKNLQNNEKAALKRLKEDESIVVVPSDKGKSVVVMDRLEYISKNELHLNDENTYQKLDRNPTQQQ